MSGVLIKRDKTPVDKWRKVEQGGRGGACLHRKAATLFKTALNDLQARVNMLWAIAMFALSIELCGHV